LHDDVCHSRRGEHVALEAGDAAFAEDVTEQPVAGDAEVEHEGVVELAGQEVGIAVVGAVGGAHPVGE
jgi:hypothetical protein